MEITKIKELKIALAEYEKAHKKSRSMYIKAINASSRAKITSVNAEWGNAAENRDKCKDICKKLILEIFGEINE